MATSCSSNWSFSGLFTVFYLYIVLFYTIVCLQLLVYFFFQVWGELMMMIGRLPTFGIYVQMFTTVAKNFAKFLAAYFCLLVAFALSFLVLFPNYRSFNVPVPAALVKTLLMMAGEVEYEDFMYDNGPVLFR